MDRRHFVTRGALGLTALTLTTAAKCGSEKVSIYISTISSFLKEIAGILPAQAVFINKIIGIAAEFDSAYRRGDFDSATTFFNSLHDNIDTLIRSLGLNVNNNVKMALAIINSTVRLIAVLLDEQGRNNAPAVLAARAAGGARATAIGTIERLAAQTAVDAAYQASKL